MAGITGRLHVQATRHQDGSIVAETTGAGAGRVEEASVREDISLANRECVERSFEQTLKFADNAFNVESILIRMKIDLEGEKKAVQALYDHCCPEDVFFPKGYSKDSVWHDTFGALKDKDDNINPASILRILDRYGCLPSEISSKELTCFTITTW